MPDRSHTLNEDRRLSGAFKLSGLMECISSELDDIHKSAKDEIQTDDPKPRFRFSALDTNLRHLLRKQEQSGYLYKLTIEPPAPTNLSTHGLSWRKRFIVLDPHGNLFLFRANTATSNGNKPLTYLCIDTCNGYFNESYDSCILEMKGDGLSPNERIERVTWILKCDDEDTLRMWLHTVNKVLLEHYEMRTTLETVLGTLNRRKTSGKTSNSNRTSLPVSPKPINSIVNCKQNVWNEKLGNQNEGLAAPVKLSRSKSLSYVKSVTSRLSREAIGTKRSVSAPNPVQVQKTLPRADVKSTRKKNWVAWFTGTK
ncbi:hypothetical protein BDR26DRAFT_924627 [Obelidium mucronatum]|nr:hypothetical protein BDR26DRAFT_924627 [Obelidium mucronatum]